MACMAYYIICTLYVNVLLLVSIRKKRTQFVERFLDVLVLFKWESN